METTSQVVKELTDNQIKDIAKSISKRWEFENHHTHYNCIDTKTGKHSNNGGDKNFASYFFNNSVQRHWLECIGEKPSYFDWQLHGVNETNQRQSYQFELQRRIVEILCGFKNK